MARRARLGLARSFQITTILPDFTVLDNVALAVQARESHSFRFVRSVSRDRRLAEAAFAHLQTVGLADRAGLRSGSL